MDDVLAYFSIPDRTEGAMLGTTFGSTILNMPLCEARELCIKQQLTELGNLPDLLRKGWRIKTEYNGHTAIFWAMADYLAVGTDEDYLRCPMNPLTATSIADTFGATLPTRKMVNEIWHQMPIKLEPQPKDWKGNMTGTPYFIDHNAMIQQQLEGMTLGLGVVGQKKDVVICRDLHPGRVAIYGWHHLSGEPIQGPQIQNSAHDISYADYSHGVRLCGTTIQVDGDKYMDIHDVLTSPELWGLLSDEGVYTTTRYPNT